MRTRRVANESKTFGYKKMEGADELEDSTELELVDDEPQPAKRRRLYEARSGADGGARDSDTAPAAPATGNHAAAPLRGVAIAISGIRNPRRSKLREIALRLGASYSGDWDDCITTHLICAFAGTPKFNEVSAKGKGTIVRPEWLEQCDQAGRRLAEVKFVVQGARSSGRLRRNSSTICGDTTLAAVGKRARPSRAGATALAGTTLPAAISSSTSTPAASPGELVDSGDETEELVDGDAGRNALRGAPPATRAENHDDDIDGYASDSTERLDEAEVTRMHASYSGDGAGASMAGGGQALSWSCPGLAYSGLSLPDFFRGVVAYLPRTAEWSSQQPPLDYRSVLRMLISNGAEVLTKSCACATHKVYSDVATRDSAPAEAVFHVDAGWVYACHRAGRKLAVPARGSAAS